MKRFSMLDTLEEEAKPNGENKGQGLYKFIETENDKFVADAKRDLNNYRREAETKLKDFQANLQAGKNVSAPKLNEPPTIKEAVRIPENLSGYISFLNPWINEILNQIVLMLMFFILVLTTLIVMRL